MSVYSDIENALDDDEERFLRDYARKEAERENEETWDEPEDDDEGEEAYEDEFVWDIPDFCEVNEEDVDGTD